MLRTCLLSHPSSAFNFIHFSRQEESASHFESDLMGSRDLISSLPDEVLGKKILSLLPTKFVVSTSVLSKRWKNLFLFVDKFDLEDSTHLRNDGFSDFMDQTVSLLSNCPIKRLTLNCHYAQSCLHRWIRTALERGCLELNLQCQYTHSLYIGIFLSNTLVKLSLSSDRIYVQGNVPPECTVLFPALKTLSLGAVVADPATYNWLISGCPVLEELFIRDFGDDHIAESTWTRSVVSTSIKRLTIYFHFPNDTYPYEKPAEIKTPNLEFLDYSSLVSDGFDVNNMDSLVEARLDLRLWELPNTWNFGDVTNLVAAIRNVKTLHLSPGTLEAFHYCCYTMPVFDKLLHLSFESDKENGWQGLPRLLLKSPNLQTLVIKGLGLVHRVTISCGNACVCTDKPKKKELYKRYEEDTYPCEVEGMCCLSTCRVKVLEISGYGGSFREVKQMEHFLGKLKYLETVRIGVEEDNENNNSDYLRDLMSLERASSKCNIQFI